MTGSAPRPSDEGLPQAFKPKASARGAVCNFVPTTTAPAATTNTKSLWDCLCKCRCRSNCNTALARHLKRVALSYLGSTHPTVHPLRISLRVRPDLDRHDNPDQPVQRAPVAILSIWSAQRLTRDWWGSRPDNPTHSRCLQSASIGRDPPLRLSVAEIMPPPAF